MPKRPAAPSGPVILCLELWRDSHPEGAVGLVASMPGREGTLQLRWSCPGGIPDAGQVADVTAKLSGMVIDAYLMAGAGVQGRLFK